MTRYSVKDASDPFFPPLWEIYDSSFPLCEKRTYADQIHILSNRKYALEVWVEDETVRGFIGWWDCGDLRYIEHYAIHPGFRSAGHGSRFLSEWLNDSNIPVLLEIEPVTDEITRRRQAFYRRLGFKDNPIIHCQPPYHKDTAAVRLRLMSYPRPITNECYERFYKKQRTVIIPQGNIKTAR
jgi:ribosomal protein S18 acetylase RimI-like enzyme